MSPLGLIITIVVVTASYHWGVAVERERQRDIDRKINFAADKRRVAEEDEVDLLLTQTRLDQLDQVHAKSQRTPSTLHHRVSTGGGVNLRLVHSGIPGETGVGDAGKAASRARHPAGRARNLQDQ